MPEIEVLHELDVATEGERDKLADDDAEPPGRKDRVERAAIERADDKSSATPPSRAPDDEGERKRRPRVEPELRGDHGAIGADRQPRAMREIDDLQHAEDGEQADRDHEQNRRRGHDVEKTAAWPAIE